jgi:hypothetical protein
LRNILDADEVSTVASLPKFEYKCPSGQRIICRYVSGVRRESRVVKPPIKPQERSDGREVCVMANQANKIALRTCTRAAPLPRLADLPFYLIKNLANQV